MSETTPICPNCKSQNVYYYPPSDDPGDDFEEVITCNDCHFYQRHYYDYHDEYTETWWVIDHVLTIHRDFHGDGDNIEESYFPCEQGNDADIEHAGKYWKLEN